MAEINHLVGIKNTSEKVFKALTHVPDLACWWTKDTRGDAKLGATVDFWFGDFQTQMKVVEAKSPQLVKWQCLKGDDEWIGTTVEFTLETTDEEVLVRFRHAGWKAGSTFFAHCSTKWAVFLLSLKELLETGKGRPYPDDIQITNS